MKRKILTSAFLLSLSIVNAQYLENYKKIALEKGANYNEIVEKTRQEINNKITQQGLKNSKLSRKDKKDRKHFERWAYYWKNRVYPDGTFPSENLGYYNAGILDANGKIKKVAKETSKLSTERWVNVGPTQSEVNNNGYVNYPQMGRLNAFLRIPHPSNSDQDILFVGAPNGGIWKSTDGGKTWNPKTDMVASIGVSDIKTVPGTTTENYKSRPIYVSTGDYDAEHSKSIGVLKSTDGGETFQSTGLSYSPLDNIITGDIMVIDENTVFVSELREIKKTTDGGNTWETVYLSSRPFSSANIERGARFGKKIMYSGSNGEVYYTNDYTNDSNWKEINAVPVNGAYAIMTMAVAHDENGEFYIQDKTGQVKKFNKSSESFENVGMPSPDYESQGGYNQSLVINDNFIISGAWDGASTSSNGKSWNLTLNGYYSNYNPIGSYAHSDHHKMGTLEGLNFWSVNDGGLNYISYKSKSDTSPEVKYLSGPVQVTQAYSVAINPKANDGAYIIANQDNDAFSKRDGKWHAVRLGDGVQAAINYNNPDIRFAVNQNGYLSKTNTGFEGQLDGMEIGEVQIYGVKFDFPLEMHTTDPTILYGGERLLYKIKDNGNSISTEEIQNTGLSDNIDFIATHGRNIAICSRNKVSMSRDNGNSWKILTKPSDASDSHYSSVDFDGANPETIYATSKGYFEASKVHKTTDGGLTWKNISYNLPNIVINEIILKQGQAGEYLFVATELGVYYLADGSNEWKKLGQGLPNVDVKDLEIHYTGDKLVAATFGRGLWEINIENRTLGINNNFEEIGAKVNIFPNPTPDILNIKIKEKGDFNYMIYNVVGGIVKSGKLSQNLDVSNLAKGIYMIRIYNNSKSTTKKIIIQ